MFVLAHLSDPHLGPVQSFKPLELWGKRGLGMINWQLRRRNKHPQRVLDAVLADLHAQNPDHIALTGDLVNLALPSEFPRALDFLNQVGSPELVSFVPGNHDSYVRAAISHPQIHWGAYMRGDEPATAAGSWPYLRRRGPLAIMGLSTSVPSGLFMATGRLGEGQLRRTAELFAQLQGTDLFRVVLLHHPPVATPGDHMKRLVDAGPLRELLRQYGAELVLHGHTHLRSLAWLPGPERSIPVVGVPSASAPKHGAQTAGYNIFRIEREGAGFACEMRAHGFAAGQDRIVELERHTLGVKRA